MSCAALLVAGLMLQQTHAPAGVLDPTPDFDRLGNSVVRITATDGKPGGNVAVGSGFVYHSRRRIATSHHVIAGAVSVEVEFAQGESIPAASVQIDREHDLAVLQLTKDAPMYAAPLSAHPEQWHRPDPGAWLYAYGHHLGFRVASHVKSSINARRRLKEIIAKVHVPDYFSRDTEILELNVNTTVGMSGAPVLDQDGWVVGIYDFGPKQGSLGINFCMVVDYLIAFDFKSASAAFATVGPRPAGDLQAQVVPVDSEKSDLKAAKGRWSARDRNGDLWVIELNERTVNAKITFGKNRAPDAFAQKQAEDRGWTTDKTFKKGWFALDEKAMPKQIDLIGWSTWNFIQKDFILPEFLTGIYRFLDDDTLEICVEDPRKARPSVFKSGQGIDYYPVLLTLKRE